MKRTLCLISLVVASLLNATAVTLNVQVPSGTPACYVAGDFNGWDAIGALRLDRVDATHFTIDLPSVTTAALAKGYKYLSGPDWAYVEKGAQGEEISNRTSPGTPDVVGSWASVYYQSENLRNFTVADVNGYDRTVEVLLPNGYDSSSASYPVIYYVGVQQRYNNAGSDTDRGDDFFGPASWGVASYIDEHPELSGAIIVATYSFVAENIPYPNYDFMGSGAADAYLADFTSKIMAKVNADYRTINDAANTSIIGADLGGVLALYAKMKMPDRFGKAVAFSPLLWINSADMKALASSYTDGGEIILTYGTREPASIADEINAFAAAIHSGALILPIASGTHDDDCWGSAFPSLYPWLAGGNTPPSSLSAAPRRAPVASSAEALTDIASTDYQLYSKVASSAPSSLDIDNAAAFTFINNYRTKGGSDVNAKVLVRVIETSVKSKFYWNVKRVADDQWLQSSMKDVSFSSKKSSDSWLRVIVHSDESVENVAASSTAFRVVGASTVTMSGIGGYKVQATVPFTTSDKSFTIHYGSVNSGSDMGEITEKYSVPSYCTKAQITYDFLTNRVEIVTTETGDVIPDVVFDTFSAVPAFNHVGGTSVVNIRLADDTPLTYTASLTASNNYGTPVNVPLTSVGNNAWTGSVSNLKSGIYTLALTLKRGSASKEVASICIRINAEPIAGQQVVTTNAYEDIDWANTGRFKANFHTHTSQSFDTQLRTDDVVDRYAAAGYKILALTDHDANPYPWDFFDLYNPEAQARNAEALGMLAIPGVELSKDIRNTWNEATGGEFNHHNDFFTGRKGMEFGSLRESYAYTNKLGGMQIINHPGQYWSINNEYTPGDKNSARWHADNFLMYPSLVGLEVYNQGNRRPNDRVLWDQILDMTMPERPVWGYSCDDSHNPDQHFRNYQFMLMPELTLDCLKDAMRNGSQYFCYEYTGSGKALAPTINSIDINPIANTITIDTPDTDVRWICATDRNGAASTRKSTVVGFGKTFDYTGYEGKYVRAIIYNSKGETCTQPFGFGAASISGIEAPAVSADNVEVTDGIVKAPGATAITLYNLAGITVAHTEGAELSTAHLDPGIYIASIIASDGTTTALKITI